MFTKSGILKILIGLSAIVLIGFGAIYFFNNEDKPTGNRGPEAEQLTQKMFDAIGYEAWQEIDYIAWNFADRQQYVWDKKRHLVQVKWGDTEVLLDPSEVSGLAIVDGVRLGEDESYNTIKKA